MSEKMTFPGFVDVHVHFRDPGMPEAETTESGLAAAAAGGFSAVVTMPNTFPAGDSPEWILAQTRRNAASSRTLIFPSACITRGRLGREVADLERLADAGAAFFTDDGSYVSDAHVMEEAMNRIADLNMVLCQHAMTLTDGVIRDCPLARRLGLPTIPATAETDAIRRDLALCRVTGCRLHIQHISTAEGVALVLDAQREGLPVTAEATPHHLLFACDDLTEDDANFKMAPPLGTREDRAALRAAVKAGALMLATDHAPHPAARKNCGFRTAANGILGLETAIPATYAALVEEEGMDVEAWAEAWWKLPRAIVRPLWGEDAPRLKPTVVTVGEPRAVDVAAFHSRARNSPYAAMRFRCFAAE